MILQLGIYKHYKGAHYHVLGIAKHSETGEMCVVYQGIGEDSAMWMRPIDMFIEKIEVNGASISRFEYIGSEFQEDVA